MVVAAIRTTSIAMFPEKQEVVGTFPTSQWTETGKAETLQQYLWSPGCGRGRRLSLFPEEQVHVGFRLIVTAAAGPEASGC